MDERTATAAKGVVGVVFAVGGAGASLATVIAWLQFVSLLVGIAVGVATFVSIVRKK
jgi:hypothetical protein